MKVGVIGCGPAGLAAIKSCITEGYDVIAFEQNSDIGGEWNSNGDVGIDVHSKIYEGLLTNIPRHCMAYSDFPYQEYDRTYLTQKEVFKYFQSYAESFNLHLHMKLCHQVIRLRPLNDDKWEIIAKDLQKAEYKSLHFDAVFICNGTNVPLMPTIEGLESFKGQIIHSRDFRNTDMFANKKVALIGSSWSALDMVNAIGKVAKRVVWVHQCKERHKVEFKFKRPECVIEMSAINRITETGAEFSNGIVEELDIVALATGYNFSFPFLSADSELYVANKCIYPLYKHCININKPTMFLIGIPFFALAMPMFELQIKFCLEFLSGRKNLPTKHEMLTEIDYFGKNESNTHKAHYLGVDKHEPYYNELAECAGIQPIKPVILKLFSHSFQHLLSDFLTFRQNKLKVLNDDEFECSCSGNL